MDCPFCGKEMREGTIPAGSQLKWADSGAEETLWGTAGVPLNSFFGGAVRGFFCPDCRQIVLPVPEMEGATEKWQRKLDAVSEKIGAAQKQWKARRSEVAEQKKKKEFGSKDPWEL